MKRREMLRLLGAAGIAGALPPVRSPQTRTESNYAVGGSGPTLIAFNRMPAGYYKGLTERYRVIVMDYPPDDKSQRFVDSFTADRVCRDILAVADAEHAER